MHVKDTYPIGLYKRLLEMSRGDWQSLLATMRWKYVNFNELPPRPLSQYMDNMPDVLDWRDYSKAITVERARIRKELKEDAERKAAYHKKRKSNEYAKKYRKLARDAAKDARLSLASERRKTASKRTR